MRKTEDGVFIELLYDDPYKQKNKQVPPQNPPTAFKNLIYWLTKSTISTLSD